MRVGQASRQRSAVQGEVKSDMRQSIFPSMTLTMTLGHVALRGAAGSPDVGITVLLAPAGAQAPPPAKGQGAGAARGPAPKAHRLRPLREKRRRPRLPHRLRGRRRVPGSSCVKRQRPRKRPKTARTRRKISTSVSPITSASTAIRAWCWCRPPCAQVEGQDKQAFMVMVPLGMMLQPGMRATLYPKDMWEKAQRTRRSTKRS